jgi:hypothetical protein
LIYARMGPGFSASLSPLLVYGSLLVPILRVRTVGCQLFETWAKGKATQEVFADWMRHPPTPLMRVII